MNTIRQEETESQLLDSCEVFTFSTLEITYRFTSWKENVEIDGNVYEAAPIKRSSFNRDLKAGTITCTVTAPVTTFFAEYIMAAPVIPASVEIRKYFFQDLSQSKLVFVGTINSVTISKQNAVAECVSSVEELKGRIPRVMVQSFCNNVFCDNKCGLNLDDFTDNIIVNVDEINSTILYAVGLGAVRENYYRLGIATFEGDMRMIVEHSILDSSITLHFPFRGLRSGDTIQISGGCDKSYDTCLNIFANLDNFTGMPYLAKGANPTIWSTD